MYLTIFVLLNFPLQIVITQHKIIVIYSPHDENGTITRCNTFNEYALRRAIVTYRRGWPFAVKRRQIYAQEYVRAADHYTSSYPNGYVAQQTTVFTRYCCPSDKYAFELSATELTAATQCSNAPEVYGRTYSKPHERIFQEPIDFSEQY